MTSSKRHHLHRADTAYWILNFLNDHAFDSNYPVGFTPHYLGSHVKEIKSQTWVRISEILEGMAKIEYVESKRDASSNQWRYKITPKGSEILLKSWKPLFDKLREASLL